ncbi:MAG: phytoene/squalene synthase family protein, partial [Rhodospirillales bacterium]
GRIRLQWWRDAVDGIYAGRPLRQGVVDALAAAVEQFGLSRRHFERVLDGRALDLGDEPPADADALIAYAEATSASLSALALEVLRIDDAAARDAAREVAIAWALIGLLRAVPFHARARRLYLPAGLNREAGLDVFGLFDRGAADGLATVVEAVAAMAADHLSAARRRSHEVPVRALPVLMPATLADLYLRRLRASRFDPFDVRVQTAPPLRHWRLAVNRLRRRY